MTFEVIPSIDLLGGSVVRLLRGSFDYVTSYSDDPLATAEKWEAEGAPRLHVVDLDGARSGELRQRETVEEIVRNAAIPVQVAGGIRNIDDAVAFASCGADRVVIGTITDELLEAAVDRLGPRLIVAVDGRDGEVRVSGWQQGTGESIVDACERFAAAGVPRLLVTDIARDGVMSGPNIGLYRQIIETAQVPVLASGGVSSVGDLATLASVEGIEGAIVGRALYDGDLELSDALEAVRG